MSNFLTCRRRSNSRQESLSENEICEAVVTALDASNNIVEENTIDSTVIDENDSQDEKHFDPRISTLFGIKID
jgi:hypothetical protein